MGSSHGRFVVGRKDNVVLVDFSREPEPPSPSFPGACGLREIGGETAEPVRPAADACREASRICTAY